MSFGWGYMPWGAGPWGAGGSGPLQLQRAVALRENMVRLYFSEAPVFDKLLGPHDASNPERYSVTAITTTIGRDGFPPRIVRPAEVEVAAVANSFGSQLNLWLDRPLSPYPTEYRIAVNGLESVSGEILDPAMSSQTFIALYRDLAPNSLEAPVPSRDVANPQTYSAQLDPLPQAGNPALLGVIPLDASGDYAFDQGVTQLKKRVIRRLLTIPGGFPANPTYGVGVPMYGKRLGIAAVRQQICAEAQLQLSKEPDVVAVSVTARTDSKNPSVTVFDIKVKSKVYGAVEINAPFVST